jgi:hypothetical protein
LDKNLHTWALPWARSAAQRRIAGALSLSGDRGLRHLLFCFCDHYEPEWGQPGAAIGEARVRAWQTGYPRLCAGFRDAHGRPPQHTFFFPGEEYRPAYLERLSELCAHGLSEVELHLHHDRDSAPALREKIQMYLGLLGDHGHFSRPGGGALRYGFIHGNWALANAYGDGKDCGVSDELMLLHETGCYADFTFPSAPHPTQPRIVNQIYWPAGDLSRARAYDGPAEPARVGRRHRDRLLLIQGPLALCRRPGRPAVRIEAAAVTAADPPSEARVHAWVGQGIGVIGRPEWVFVKVHTHGAPEKQAEALLGPAGHALHTALLRHYNDGTRWALHYVTARELYNIACAAMDGASGDPGRYRDHELPPPPIRKPRA